MQRTELEQKILDYIKTTYSANYIGYIAVTQVDNLYTLALGIPSYMAKTYISCEASSDEEFLEYAYKELASRNYVRQDTYKVIRTNEKTEY